MVNIFFLPRCSPCPAVERCWIFGKPTGKDDTKASRMYGLYRDWPYRKEIWRFFGLVEVGEVCWMYGGPIEKDESDGEMVAWFQ